MYAGYKFGAYCRDYFNDRLETDLRRRRLEEKLLHRANLGLNGFDIDRVNAKEQSNLSSDITLHNCLRRLKEARRESNFSFDSKNKLVSWDGKSLDFYILHEYTVNEGSHYYRKTDRKNICVVSNVDELYSATNFRFGRKKWIGEYLRRIEEENPEAYDLLASKLPRK